MSRLRLAWLSVQGSLWFVPSLIVCAAVAAAAGLVEMQSMFGPSLSDRFPRLFGAGAEGARAMLAAIAASTITVAGVVFSITVVALSLAASQYSPRVLRNFMSDRATQAVLGAFVGIHAYCLVVLRTIRGPGEGAFIPSVAVLVGVGLAFVGVAMLIYFIHHLASSIQVPSILERISRQTAGAIDRLFPSELGQPACADSVEECDLPPPWIAIPSRAFGYVQGVDGETLLKLAAEKDLVVRVLPRVGEFVVKELPLLHVAGAGALDDRLCLDLLACVAIDRERTVHQDAEYGVQLIVDIALKALSPGIHDPTTALDCIDHLGALMVRLSGRRIDSPCRSRDGTLRLVAEGAGYASMMALAFGSIIQHAATHAVIYERIVRTLELISAAAQGSDRRAVIEEHAAAVIARVATVDLSRLARGELLRRAETLVKALRCDAGSPAHAGRSPSAESIRSRA